MRRQRAAWLCVSEFVNAAIETGYHLNQMYQPFYKWKMRGMDAFHVLTDLKEKLTQLMQMSGADSENDGQSSAQSQIEDICVGVVKELNRQGLTETKMKHFWKSRNQEIIRRLQSDAR